MNEQQLREGLHRLAPHVEEVGVWEALHERRRRRAPRAAWAAAVLVIVLATLGFGMNAIVQHLSHHADVVVITDDTMSPGSTEPASTETVTTTLSGTSGPSPHAGHRGSRRWS
jgi:type IV secretory pathway component VirB8